MVKSGQRLGHSWTRPLFHSKRRPRRRRRAPGAPRWWLTSRRARTDSGTARAFGRAVGWRRRGSLEGGRRGEFGAVGLVKML